MAAHLESSRRDRTPCRSYLAAPRQRRRHGTRSARFSGASSPGRRNADSESPPALPILDQIVAAGRLGRKALRELRDGAQIFLHPPSILAESRSLSQVDSRFLGAPQASGSHSAADRANSYGRGRFYWLSRLQRRCGGVRPQPENQVSGPPFGVLFHALSRDPDLKVRTALDRAATRIEGKFAGKPEVEAAIRDTVGQTYVDLGLIPEGRKQLERALELQRRVLGMDNLKTLKTLDHLGRVVSYPEAEALYRQTLEIRRRLLGPEH